MRRERIESALSSSVLSQTRENALQLLIFSLVTFPSTEFKLELVASRVVTMVADRRRRVRQAALDTLAIIAQVYDSEVHIARDSRDSNPSLPGGKSAKFL